MGTLNLGHLQGLVRDSALGAVAGCSVTVYARPTSGAGAVNTDGTLIGSPTKATLYSDQDGDSAITNPLTTGTDGNFACFVAPGAYDLKISGGPLSASYGEQFKQVVGAVSDLGHAGMPEGAARAYYVADAAAKTALTKMLAGDLCYQVDTGALYCYNGSAWVRVQAKSCGYIPLGVASGISDGIAVADTYEDVNTVPATGGWGVSTWKAGAGILFTNADWPEARTIKLVFVGCTDITTRQGYVRLYDATAGAAVTDSEITLSTGAGSTTRQEYRSSEIVLVTAHKYRFQFMCAGFTGMRIYVAAAYLEIVSD